MAVNSGGGRAGRTQSNLPAAAIFGGHSLEYVAPPTSAWSDLQKGILFSNAANYMAIKGVSLVSTYSCHLNLFGHCHINHVMRGMHTVTVSTSGYFSQLWMVSLMTSLAFTRVGRSCGDGGYMLAQ